MQYNIYCDESCHLENDKHKVMVLGAIWSPKKESKSIACKIRDIKIKHNLNKEFEVKWIKVSQGKHEFYRDIIEYFFNENDLHFRALIVPDKTVLDHRKFNQDHDEWYYKMYFDLLKIILDPDDEYFIYIDIKDTHSSIKLKKLHDVLCNNAYDFNRKIIRRVQPVRSNEIEQIQLTDLLIGAISYLNRDLKSNLGKTDLIEYIRRKTGYSLTKTTLLREEKFNIFKWQAKNAR